MIIGVDSSGKIGSTMYIAAVFLDHDETVLKQLRKKVKSRHLALASRRRIKANALRKSELDFVRQTIKSNYEIIKLPATQYRVLKQKSKNVPRWKFAMLSHIIFELIKKNIHNKDVILIDRDYDIVRMKYLCERIMSLAKQAGLDIFVETGTSFNDAIALADLVAGCARKKVIKSKELSTKKITAGIHERLVLDK